MIDLLVFSTGYCQPCKVMESTGVYEAVIEAGFDVEKIDSQANLALARQYGVSAVPTMFVRKNGEIVGKTIGGKTANQLIALLRQYEDA